MSDSIKTKKEILTPEERQEIIDKLSARGAPRSCPMCSATNWTVSDGYINHTMQPSRSAMNLGGKVIPSFALICTNCGFISQHAIGILEQIKEDSEAQDD